MKKFLAIALFIVLVASVFVVASAAEDTPAYWSINPACLVKAKTLADGKVPTFKATDASTGVDGLLVGLPTNATYGDNYFQAKDGYTREYYDFEGKKIDNAAAHIGTTDEIVVYKDGVKVATYGLVTYGDADGDGVFDVIDAAIAALCQTGKMDATENPAVYESVKPRLGFDDEVVQPEDYQYIVNDAKSDKNNIVENIKGRKTPIDDTLSFESVIYAYTGAARAAAVTANDSRLKYAIRYNDADTVPTAAGIYSVTAEVADSEEYLVNSGTRELGFIVIAPKEVKNSEGAYTYKVNADNANKKLSVVINKAYDTFGNFNTSINNWCNSAYTLKVNNTSVATHADVLSALAPRDYNHYTGQSTKLVTTSKKDVLGCYLPADDVLYEDYKAKRTVPVVVSDGTNSFSFNLEFSQDEEKILTHIRDYELTVSEMGRGQRNTDQRDVECYGLRVNGERVISAKIRSHGLLLTKTQSTGLKGMMVGVTDAISFKATTTKGDYSSAETTSMFDASNSNTRYNSYKDLDLLKVQTMVNNFLKNVLGLSRTPSSTRDIKGRSGWAMYQCSNETTGLRYGLEYKFEFVEATSSTEVKRTMTIDSNVTNGKITLKPAESTKYSVYESMVEGEQFCVFTTPSTGYVVDTVTVKDASGNTLTPDKYGLYIMPASNVTVTATFKPAS